MEERLTGSLSSPDRQQPLCLGHQWCCPGQLQGAGEGRGWIGRGRGREDREEGEGREGRGRRGEGRESEGRGRGGE